MTYLHVLIIHFSPYDCNSSAKEGTQDGNADDEADESDEDDECEGSQIDVNSGRLKTDFPLPGLNVRSGGAPLGFVYNSATACPTKVIRLKNYYDERVLNKPEHFSFQMRSPLISSGASSGGSAAFVAREMYMNINNRLGFGGIILGGSYPSGRQVQTGYQTVSLKFTNYYQGKYALSSRWGGMPSRLTNVPAAEPVYLEEKKDKKYFLVSRAKSPYGTGWWPEGLKQLHFDGSRVVVIEGSGSFLEYDRGVNFANAGYGAAISWTSHPMNDRQSMLYSSTQQRAKKQNPAMFNLGGSLPPPGTNQILIIDLGRERTISAIGINFQRYWKAVNIWDYIKIFTSVDNNTWEDWYQFGMPTLNQPYLSPDPLDGKIDSPVLERRQPRSVRYIKYELGYPAVNSAIVGSVINQVLAYGNETEYCRLDQEKWPRLFQEDTSGNYVLEDFSGKQTVFNPEGMMIAEKDISGRSVTYEYADGRLSRISYPEGVWYSFAYGGSGCINLVTDSSGRQTRFESDNDGHVTAVVYPDGTSRQFSYDTRGLLQEDKQGDAVKRYAWDERWPILKEVQLPDGGKKAVNSWIAANLLNEKTGTMENPADFPTNSIIDNGKESSITMADGRVEKYVSGGGWRTRYVNGKLKEKITYADARTNSHPQVIEEFANGRKKTVFTYGDDMRIQRIDRFRTEKNWQVGQPNHPYVPATGESQFNIAPMTYQYNDKNLVSKISYSWPNLDVSYTYDDRGNVVVEERKTSESTLQTRYTYSEANDLVKTEYPDGRKVEMEYDSKGLLVKVKNNDNTAKTLERNERGEITAVVDEQNRRVELTRDAMGRVTKEKSPSSREVRYEYGGEGCSTCGDSSKLVRIIDAGNKTWEFKYDLMGNVTEMIYPDGTKVTQEYDTSGRLVKYSNRRGQEIGFQYDADGRLQKKITPEGTVDFIYDEWDRIAEINASDYHYKYQYGYVGGLGTVWHQDELNSGTFLQMVFDQSYGMPLHVYDPRGIASLDASARLRHSDATASAGTSFIPTAPTVPWAFSPNSSATTARTTRLPLCRPRSPMTMRCACCQKRTACSTRGRFLLITRTGSWASHGTWREADITTSIRPQDSSTSAGIIRASSRPSRVTGSSMPATTRTWRSRASSMYCRRRSMRPIPTTQEETD